MFNMIKADFYRMSKSKGMYIFWISIVLTYCISLFSKMPGGISLGMPVNFSEGTKLDIRQMGMNFTWFFLLIIPVYVIVTADFGEKTVKNTITSAISRKKYYLVKTVFAEVFSVASFLGCNILFYLLNSLKNGSAYTSDFPAFFKVVLLQLPVMMAVVAAMILIAFLVKKTAAYNAIVIVTPLVYTLIAITFYSIKSTKAFAEKFLLKYEVGYMLNRLADNESRKYVNGSFIICAIVFIFSLIAGYMLFTKREID